jgi:outer membrane protein assembly factor BamD
MRGGKFKLSGMRYWTLALLMLTAVALQANFAYDTKSGWKSEDKTLEKRLSEGAENPDALRLMNEAAAIYARGNIEKARTTYRELVKRYPTSLLAPEAFYQIGKIRLQQKKIDKAYEAYGHIVGEYPGYANFDGLLKEMFDLAERISNEKTASVFGVWNYKDRDAAIAAFEKIVTAAPYSDYAPRALFLIARLYKEKKEPLSSIDAYERLVGSYPNHPLACDSYFNVAETYRGMIAGAPYDQGATQQAIRYYEEFIALFPDDARVAEAQGKLQRMHEILAQGKYDTAVFYYNKRNNILAASTLLKEAIQTAPESSVAQKAQQLLEKIDKEGGKKKTANKKFLDALLFWKN